MTERFLDMATFEEVRIASGAVDVLVSEPLSRRHPTSLGRRGRTKDLPVVLLSDRASLLDVDRLACRLAVRHHTLVPDLRRRTNQVPTDLDELLAPIPCPVVIGVGVGAVDAVSVAGIRREAGQPSLLVLVDAAHLGIDPAAAAPSPIEWVEARGVPVPSSPNVRSAYVMGARPGSVLALSTGVDAVAAAVERVLRQSPVS